MTLQGVLRKKVNWLSCIRPHRYWNGDDVVVIVRSSVKSSRWRGTRVASVGICLTVSSADSCGSRLSGLPGRMRKMNTWARSSPDPYGAGTADGLRTLDSSKVG